MYLPKHYEGPGKEELHRLIAEYPFGALVVNGPQGLDANHIPFELHADQGEHGHLIGHVARANPVWQEIRDGSEVLVIFQGGDAYISPNWYPSKHEQHKQVPTWNYRLVHVHGRLRIRDDEKFVRGVVARLTRKHESRTGDARPWKMSDSAPEYIDQLLTMIVGIEVEITRITGKWKLSQNKEERDRANAAAELEKRGEKVVSTAMRKTLPEKSG
jgi:transcriptional regulator